jgi:isopentenyl-diphosphate Delta-isomerase
MIEEVILVNERDEPVGVMEKMEAHQKGVLHRAFSVFIFDRKGHMLLQQRALQKYHGAGLWTNACCSHPYPGEAVHHAARRRLMEELGFRTEIKEIFSFTYHAALENNLIEHEYDHVFAGEYEGDIRPNRDEVKDHAYRSIESLEAAIKNQPQEFTSWFIIAFPRVKAWWENEYRSKRNVGAVN